MAVANETAATQTVATETAGAAAEPSTVPATLWDALGAIIDRRGRKGRQYPLQALLAVAIAAVLAGANDLRAIFRWGRRLTPEALALFGLEKAPCHSQWFYLFRSLDADALAATLGAFALAGAEPGHLAMDGKTLRGSRRRDTKALHVVAAFSTRLSVVVGDVVLEPDQNEITAALILLKKLPLEGVIVTGDAIFCQRGICEEITDGGGDYAFVVKDNQPELKAAIAESFGELSPLRSPASGPRRAAT